MTIPERPCFMTNKEWYYFDEEEGMYKLTDKAPEKARKSYKEFYELLESQHIYDMEELRKMKVNINPLS